MDMSYFPTSVWIGCLPQDSLLSQISMPKLPADAPARHAAVVNLTAVVQEEYAHVYRFTLALTGSPEAAQDATQQAFLALTKYQSTIQDWSRIRSWLFTTARRAHLGAHSKLTRRGEVSLEDAGEEHFSEEAPDFAGRIDGAAAVVALQQLELSQREVLALFYLEDFSYEEIATQLEIPLGTVMSRLHRGKKRLAAILSDPQ